MKKHKVHNSSASLSIVVFQPQPNVLYSLDIAAHLAGVSRRLILVYCRAGFVQPVLQPPYGVMAFTAEAIHTFRRLEHMRTLYGLEVNCLKPMIDLLDEVERLRAEVRFLRNQ